MFKILYVIIVCAFFMSFSVFAGPTQINMAEKTFQNDLNYPSVHITLLSIEDKLRNLESVLGVQCATAINGRIDYYGRKIDNIERDLSRFQVYMRMELDKISENISSKNFKDDITKDRIIRKVDAVYERINHKLGNIEGQIDLTNIKSQNAGEIMLTKLEKMEDSLTVRDADMEAELADAVAAIDDLKTTCTNMEENIINVTKESTKSLLKSNEKLTKKQYIQTINVVENTNKSLSNNIVSLQTTLDLLVKESNNTSNVVKHAKDELDENLNEYANKITNMYSSLWTKTDTLDNALHNLAKVANLTRNEQQNGLRALMVQVGRKSGKQGVQSDSSIDNQKLIELSEKIDRNFENVMLAQNLFLESCHRVQMDESQLESQISVVLERLIDIFENKTSVRPEDINQLKQLIRTHDSNTRRSIYHITNTLLALTQKTTDSKEEIIDYINNQRLQLEAVYVILQNVLNFNSSDERLQNILETLQGFERQLNETHRQTYTTLSQINTTNNFITKMLNTSYNNTGTNNSKLQQTLEFIKNIYHILASIEMKINKSYLDYYFNKYNIDAIAHRFGKKLNDYIQSTEVINATKTKNGTKTKKVSENGQQIPELLLQIFTENNNELHTTDPYDDFPYTSQTPSSNEDGVKNIILLCKSANATVNCDKMNETKYTILKQNETENNINNTAEQLEKTINSNTDDTTTLNNNCLPNYIDLIDVRSNDGININLNCTLANTTADTTHNNSTNNIKLLEEPEHTTDNSSLNKCLPNYINLIDVRSSEGTNITLNCSQTNIIPDATPNNSTNNAGDLEEAEETTNNSNLNECLPNYIDLIDVRSSDGLNITPNCSLITSELNNSTNNTTNYNDEDEESYDIDVRFEKLNDTENSEYPAEQTNEAVSKTSLEEYSTDTSSNQEQWDVNTSSVTQATQEILSRITTNAIFEGQTSTTQGDIKMINSAKGNQSEEESSTISHKITTENSTLHSEEDEWIAETLIDNTNTLEEKTTEENYPAASLEDDLTDINSEFEYTNHEYH